MTSADQPFDSLAPAAALQISAGSLFIKVSSVEVDCWVFVFLFFWSLLEGCPPLARPGYCSTLTPFQQ